MVSVKNKVKSGKYSSMSLKPRKICPKCGSLEVFNLQPIMGTHPVLECRTCGHADRMFPEVDIKDIEHFREKLSHVPLEKRKPVYRHVPRGPGNKTLGRIMGAILVMIALILLYWSIKDGFDAIMVAVGLLLLILGSIIFYTGFFKKILNP